MRDKRVLFYGGPHLNAGVSRFVEELAFHLLSANDRIRIVTGGFKAYRDKPEGTSTDVSAASGAIRFAAEKGVPVDSVLETFLPDPLYDDPLRKIERFGPTEGGERHVLKGISDKARRLKLVQLADAVITVAGHRHTALVLEMAIAAGRPALPLAFTGGDSEDYWKAYEPYFLERLGLSDADAGRIQDLTIPATPERAAECRTAIAKVVGQLIQNKNCLVLMRFRQELDPFYARLKKAIEDSGYFAIRLDHQVYPGDIRDTIQKYLRECRAVIAVVTDQSPNVMYELGLAHAFGRSPLLLCGSLKDLPFYLKLDRTLEIHDDTRLTEALAPYLQAPEPS